MTTCLDALVTPMPGQEATEPLEKGAVIFLPDRSFSLSRDEIALLKPECVNPKTKSIKYSPASGKIWGTAASYGNSPVLAEMLQRYTRFAQQVIAEFLPSYPQSVTPGNASFRPVEAAGRSQSKRHDDRLLHVDAFPSRPMHGKRLLRVFTNINHAGTPRFWRTGESFTSVATRFLPRIGAPFPGSATVLKKLGITKEKRSLYDHYMLQIHDRMKYDAQYQATVPHTDITFPAGASWIVYSDQVSHAVLSGQHAMEQTFLLSPDAMQNPALSPLRELERLTARTLL